MDGLSAVASIIAAIQLADRVVDLSLTFIGDGKGAAKEIVQIITTTPALRGFLDFLRKFIESEAKAHRLIQLYSLCRSDGPLDLCTKLMKEIESKMRLSRSVEDSQLALDAN